jgi:hypothetical protein
VVHAVLLVRRGEHGVLAKVSEREVPGFWKHMVEQMEKDARAAGVTCRPASCTQSTTAIRTVAPPVA